MPAVSAPEPQFGEATLHRMMKIKLIQKKKGDKAQ
jgi:hypothetical protein